MLLKFSCSVDKLIRKQIKFTVCFYLKINRDQEKYQFLNMCNLCRYAQFLQAQSHIIKLVNVKQCEVYCISILVAVIIYSVFYDRCQ